MFIPGSTQTNTNLPITTMNNNLHQQQFLFDNLKDHRSNKLLSPMSRKTSATPNFLLDPEILRELNARYLHDIHSTRTPPSVNNSNLDPNGLSSLLLPPFLRAEHYHQHTHTHEHNLNILTPTNNSLLNGNVLLDKLSKSDNSLSPFLRTTAANNFSLAPPPPPPSIFPPFSLINNSTTNSTSSSINTKTKESPSPSAKKSNKWCAAHVRVSWMIYHQQQRSKDKSSIDNNTKKDDEQQQQSLSNTKPIFPPALSTNNELSLPLPSTTFQSSVLPPAAFNFRAPFDFANVNNNGPFARLAPSSNTAFGGLGSLFPPPPPQLSSSDRKSELNGSVAAAAALGLDWSRFHRGISGTSSLIPPSTNNDNLLAKKLDETNSNNDKKRSSSVLNNLDDDRRTTTTHHHLMHPPISHTTNSPNYSSNRSRSRSPHRSIHQHHSSSLLTKTSSSPPSHSSSRKRSSPHLKSDNSKTSPLIPPLPPTFAALDPLTLSIIERQRLSAAYASLIANGSPTNSFFPSNIDAAAMYRPNGTANLFPNVDSSAMTAALMQREHFLHSLRQQQEFIERERAAVASMTKNSSKISQQKLEQITSPKRSPKPAVSPSSHSSASNSSSSSSSKKVKHVKREQDSSSPSATVPSTKENLETTIKDEPSTIQSTAS